MLRFFPYTCRPADPTFHRGLTNRGFRLHPVAAGEPDHCLLAGSGGVDPARYAETAARCSVSTSRFRTTQVQYYNYSRRYSARRLWHLDRHKRPVLDEFLTLFRRPSNWRFAPSSCATTDRHSAVCCRRQVPARGSIRRPAWAPPAAYGYSMPSLLCGLFAGSSCFPGQFCSGTARCRGRISLDLISFSQVTLHADRQACCSGQSGASSSALSHLVLPTTCLAYDSAGG